MYASEINLLFECLFQWLTLDNVKTGEINLSCTWFDLKKDPIALERVCFTLFSVIYKYIFV